MLQISSFTCTCCHFFFFSIQTPLAVRREGFWFLSSLKSLFFFLSDLGSPLLLPDLLLNSQLSAGIGSFPAPLTSSSVSGFPFTRTKGQKIERENRVLNPIPG